MKLNILSDIHLEYSTFEPFVTDTDVIVLAGDIGKKTNGLSWARQVFPDKPIVYVPGNHEFYGADRIETLDMMRKAADHFNIHLLDNDEVVISGVRFLGSTLWTDFQLFGDEKKLAAMAFGKSLLNDFKLIQEGAGVRFSPARSIQLHEQALIWLTSKLAEPYAGKTVVVTHHLPSKQSVSERFSKDILSACFASNLDHLFGKADLWIHGHTHTNFDYQVKKTRVICNPRGYVTYQGQENSGFNPKLVVDL